MRSNVALLGVSSLISFAVLACSADNGGATFGGGGGDSVGNGNAATTAGQGGAVAVAAGTGGDLGLGGGPTGSTGAGQSQCDAMPDEDKDGDGFSKNQGDCNDCDANVNPNALEVIADGAGGAPVDPADEDCNGVIDDIPEPCDQGLVTNSLDPYDGAKAVELCKKAVNPGEWGVSQALWVKPDGQPFGGGNFDFGHGLLPAFGAFVNVQAGTRMLGLSSGAAREPTDPEYHDVGGFDKGYTSGSPQGFPKESPACPGTLTGQPHDGAALELKIRTPSNAQGFSFDFNFFTYEWPGFVCSTYNDFFVAELIPWPAGQQDGNISFDTQGNPVSVNNAFLEVCGCMGGPPCMAGGKTFTCALGNQSLLGNGFGIDMGYADHGSTFWLVTKAPVAPNADIVIRWSVYDWGDGVLDTTTLIDNWQWIATPGTTVGTDPIPDPR